MQSKKNLRTENPICIDLIKLFVVHSFVRICKTQASVFQHIGTVGVFWGVEHHRSVVESSSIFTVHASCMKIEVVSSEDV